MWFKLSKQKTGPSVRSAKIVANLETKGAARLGNPILIIAFTMIPKDAPNTQTGQRGNLVVEKSRRLMAGILAATGHIPGLFILMVAKFFNMLTVTG